MPRPRPLASFEQLADALQAMYPDRTLQRFDTFDSDIALAVSFGDVLQPNDEVDESEEDEDRSGGWMDDEREVDEEERNDPNSPVLTALYLYPDEHTRPDPHSFYLEEPHALVEEFSCLPSFSRWWGGLCQGNIYQDDRRSVLILDLDLIDTDEWDGGDGVCVVAFWAVQEGWVLVVWSLDTERLRGLMGLSEWPRCNRWETFQGAMGV